MKIKEIKDKKKLEVLYKDWIEWMKRVGNRTAGCDMDFFMSCWGSRTIKEFYEAREEITGIKFPIIIVK